MRATIMYEAGDVRVEDVPDPTIHKPTDAIVRVVRSCICGSDLWPFASMPATEGGHRMGHEFIGLVEEVGSAVSSVRRGDLVVAPFFYADNTCQYCREGLHTSCRQGGFWGNDNVDGAQGEAVRVPQAEGTLVRLPATEDPDLLASFLALSDVMCTGYHAAATAGVSQATTVTVIGDGAVGLSAVLAARLMGAEQIILMGRHEARTALGSEYGATHVVAERGAEGIAKVRELASGEGTHTVLECVGTSAAIETALGAVRDGGTVSRVGAPQYPDVPMDGGTFVRNITLTGGIAPARAYIETLLPMILDGRINPGRVFDSTISLDQVPQGYQAMADREALKVIIKP